MAILSPPEISNNTKIYLNFLYKREEKLDRNSFSSPPSSIYPLNYDTLIFNIEGSYLNIYDANSNLLLSMQKISDSTNIPSIPYFDYIRSFPDNFTLHEDKDSALAYYLNDFFYRSIYLRINQYPSHGSIEIEYISFDSIITGESTPINIPIIKYYPDSNFYGNDSIYYSISLDSINFTPSVPIYIYVDKKYDDMPVTITDTFYVVNKEDTLYPTLNDLNPDSMGLIFSAPISGVIRFGDLQINSGNIPYIIYKKKRSFLWGIDTILYSLNGVIGTSYVYSIPQDTIYNAARLMEDDVQKLAISSYNLDQYTNLSPIAIATSSYGIGWYDNANDTLIYENDPIVGNYIKDIAITTIAVCVLTSDSTMFFRTYDNTWASYSLKSQIYKTHKYKKLITSINSQHMNSYGIIFIVYEDGVFEIFDGQYTPTVDSLPGEIYDIEAYTLANQDSILIATTNGIYSKYYYDTQKFSTVVDYSSNPIVVNDIAYDVSNNNLYIATTKGIKYINFTSTDRVISDLEGVPIDNYIKIAFVKLYTGIDNTDYIVFLTSNENYINQKIVLYNPSKKEIVMEKEFPSDVVIYDIGAFTYDFNTSRYIYNDGNITTEDVKVVHNLIALATNKGLLLLTIR